MILRNKKGDVNWFIVSLIIIIVSLVVIVAIFLRLNPSSEVDRVACMESAVFRASLPETLDVKDVVPLSCKTKRICVTSKVIGDGDCKKGLGNEYTTYRLTGNVEAKENQIKMVLAREMAECWNMFGEGNLQVFLREISKNTINGKIVVCSRVMFDSSVTNDFQTVSGMNNYLLSHKVPGKDLSYWDYFRNAYDGDTLQMLSGNAVVGSELNDVLDLSSQKAIFYMESSVTQMGGVVGAVVGVGTSTLLLGSFGGAGYRAAAFLGRGITGPLAILGFAGYQGWNIGDNLVKNWIAPDLENGVLSGVFLTDYSANGFNSDSFSKQNIEFENIP